MNTDTMNERAAAFARKMLEMNRVLDEGRWNELLADANGDPVEAIRLAACVILESAWDECSNAEVEVEDES